MSFFFPQIVQIDSGEKKRKGGQFKVGKKKVKTKLSALAKAKAAQAMQFRLPLPLHLLRA